MIICPNCEGENADNAIHCGFCGARLDEGSGNKQTMLGMAGINVDQIRAAAEEARRQREAQQQKSGGGGEVPGPKLNLPNLGSSTPPPSSPSPHSRPGGALHTPKLNLPKFGGTTGAGVGDEDSSSAPTAALDAVGGQSGPGGAAPTSAGFVAGGGASTPPRGEDEDATERMDPNDLDFPQDVGKWDKSHNFDATLAGTPPSDFQRLRDAQRPGGGSDPFGGSGGVDDDPLADTGPSARYEDDLYATGPTEPPLPSSHEPEVGSYDSDLYATGPTSGADAYDTDDSFAGPTSGGPTGYNPYASGPTAGGPGAAPGGALQPNRPGAALGPPTGGGQMGFLSDPKNRKILIVAAVLTAVAILACTCVGLLFLFFP